MMWVGHHSQEIVVNENLATASGTCSDTNGGDLESSGHGCSDGAWHTFENNGEASSSLEGQGSFEDGKGFVGHLGLRPKATQD